MRSGYQTYSSTVACKKTRCEHFHWPLYDPFSAIKNVVAIRKMYSVNEPLMIQIMILSFTFLKLFLWLFLCVIYISVSVFCSQLFLSDCIFFLSKFHFVFLVCVLLFILFKFWNYSNCFDSLNTMRVKLNLW